MAPGFAVICALLIVAIIVILWLWRRYEALLESQDRAVRDARRDSVDQSRSTLKGQLSEQMAPLLPGFSYLPSDSRFLGDPVDYVVFSGYSALGESGTAEEDLEIVFVEVKRANASLKAGQKAIGRAVQEGRVRFEVARVGEDGNVTITKWGPTRRGLRGGQPDGIDKTGPSDARDEDGPGRTG